MTFCSSLIARSIAVLAVLFALAVAEPATAAPPSVSRSCQGALGERVDLGPPAQAHATIVFFMSRRSQQESAALARSVDEQLLDAPIEQVGIVDTHRYGGWLRGIAMRHLEKAAHESLTRRRERRIAHGADASADQVGRWHLVGDFDAALFDLFGVEHEPAHPLAFLVDRTGKVTGPFRDAAAVITAYSALSATPR